MFTVVVVVIFFFCYFFSFVESVEMLITFIAFTIILPVVVPVLFVFLHSLFVVVFLVDTYASVYSIGHAADVPVPVLENHSLHEVDGYCRGIPLP